MATPFSNLYKRFGVDAWIARWYANMTTKDMGRHDAMAQKVAAVTATGSRVLEIAPGAGYLAINLARTGRYEVTGLDINRTFVEIASRKAAERGVEIDFVEGDVASIPFQDETFDFIVCCAAFKNFTQPVRALQEMHRVLRPGGRVLLNDLRRDITMQATEGEMGKINQMNLTDLNQRLVRLIFRHILLKRAYTKAQVEQLISKTDFVKSVVREDPAYLEIELYK